MLSPDPKTTEAGVCGRDYCKKLMGRISQSLLCGFIPIKNESNCCCVKLCIIHGLVLIRHEGKTGSTPGGRQVTVLCKNSCEKTHTVNNNNVQLCTDGP